MNKGMKGMGRRNGAGRKKGTPNKVPAGFIAEARAFINGDAYWENLKKRILKGQAPNIERYMLERLLGRAVLQVKDVTPQRNAGLEARAKFLASLTPEERIAYFAILKKAVVIDVQGEEVRAIGGGEEDPDS